MNAEQAQRLIDAAITSARGEGIAVCIAIVDAAAHLQAFHRMDGAMLGTIDVAISKARTSVLFPVSTADFGELVRQEKLDGMLSMNGGMVGFPGGVPLQGGGAIGVSGGTAEQDETICISAAGAV